MNKKLTNKRLVGFLMEHRHIELVTVSKDKVIATVSAKFTPKEVPGIVKEVGQMPRCISENGVNYIVFSRY